MAKNHLTEICDLVGYVAIESYFGYNSGNDRHCKVTEIQFLSKSLDLITKTYTIDDCEKALEMFVKDNFNCDDYFITSRKCDYKDRSSRYGYCCTTKLECNLHIVTKLQTMCDIA